MNIQAIKKLIEIKYSCNTNLRSVLDYFLFFYCFFLSILNIPFSKKYTATYKTNIFNGERIKNF